ncbi:MAG: VCBS repeat-containing protein [Chitinophagaceae bacterium]|nr:VCBS repeat-containing protein [Chitinophagaceae bacterium]
MTKAQHISIFSNTTASGSVTPTYGTRQDIGGFNNPVYVAIVDFTQDGKKDILVVNKNNGYLGVLVNNTTPGSSIFTFNLQYFSAMGTPEAVVLGDLNGDDKIDMVASATNGGLYFHFNYSYPGSGSILFSSFSFYAGGICNLMLTDLGDGKTGCYCGS